MTCQPLSVQAPLAIPKLSGKKINRTNVTISEMVSMATVTGCRGPYQRL